eukprot:gnl/TRDRNA2_/TRDRNA2_42801_c0_seq1.p1 gnl/TRDRNA2_/TRDRNA2_42801_c0~~gnl/TRDRNA2_/TRDRNA2_42801_c0_seq1.p1  ORF type:complete len:393 (+),score=56.58 gnl/TRDRNA2_/TRDRNA2_42801_c0_seq1:40-1179(+)
MERSTLATLGASKIVAVGAGGAFLLVAGPKLWFALRKSIEFVAQVAGSGSSVQRHNRIGGYNDAYNASEESAEARKADYAKVVDAYYDLATEFYEWGWGNSFHFANCLSGETYWQAIKRHEWYLAGRLGVCKGAKVLDCGCGVGGPARNIARFTEAHVTAVTINQFQVDRSNTHSKKEHMSDMVETIQGDFMNLPFENASFDGVYAIEATCHAPDRVKCFKEILRVLKPGAVFACYEWGLTDKYDSSSAEHRRIKKAIEEGDGLPDLAMTTDISKALATAGFEVLESRDCALDNTHGGSPWYQPLVPSYNPLCQPGFQFCRPMLAVVPRIISIFETLRIFPSGTSATQVMLQNGGLGCADGGLTGIFTPMYLMVGRKPL